MAERRFSFSDDKSKKFWAIEVIDSTVTVRFGREGTAGTKSEKELGSPAAAAKEAAKLIAEKTKKGYVEEGAAPAATPTKAAATPKTKSKSVAASAKPAEPAGSDAAALDELLITLDAALKVYAPTVLAKLEGTASFAALEAHVTVPAVLRSWWGWANGGSALEGLFLTGDDKDGESGWEAILSVDDSASALTMLRETANFPETLIPLAGDGNGNYLVVDPEGAVLDWDHETRKTTLLMPSIVALLRRALQALKKGVLFGGPERKPGELAANVVRVHKLIKKLEKGSKAPEVELERLTNNIYQMTAEETYDALMHPAVVAAAKSVQAHERSGWASMAATACADLGRWDDLFKLKPLGNYSWARLGNRAFAAGAVEAALQCFEYSMEREMAGGIAQIDGYIGAAYVGNKLGRPTAALLKQCFAKIDAELADNARIVSPPNPDPKTQAYCLDLRAKRDSQALFLRAVTARVAGDEPLVHETMSTLAKISEGQRWTTNLTSIIADSGVLEIKA